MDLTNGTLDTRLSQDLTQTITIPCNKEYDRFSAFRTAGGNGIWLVHCPSGVKAYFATENNFEKKVPLNQENRGMRFAKIGEEGIPKLFDNFYIFTEGTSADDNLIITISSQESAVEPILGNASGNIAQLDEVGGFSTNAINDMARAVLGGVCPKCNNKFQKQILINGTYEFAPNQNAQGLKLYHFPLGKDFKIKDLNLDDNTLYRIRQIGHFDIGQARRDTDGTQIWRYKISDPVTYNYRTNPVIFEVKDGECQSGGHTICFNERGYTDISFNNENTEVTFYTKSVINIGYGCYPYSYLKTDVQEDTKTFSLNFREADFMNQIYDNMIKETVPCGRDFSYTGESANYNDCLCSAKRCYPVFACCPGTATLYGVQNITKQFIKDVTTETAAATTTSFFSIYQSAHLSLIKEVSTPSYIDVPTGISNTFSNLLTSLSIPYYQKFDLWGQKVRHSNKDNIINNYEGTGINANAFDLVVSGAILNQYDNFMLGWNVTNLYNPDLKLTASAADCHSSMILEITEL